MAGCLEFKGFKTSSSLLCLTWESQWRQQCEVTEAAGYLFSGIGNSKSWRQPKCFFCWLNELLFAAIKRNEDYFSALWWTVSKVEKCMFSVLPLDSGRRCLDLSLSLRRGGILFYLLKIKVKKKIITNEMKKGRKKVEEKGIEFKFLKLYVVLQTWLCITKCFT